MVCLQYWLCRSSALKAVAVPLSVADSVLLNSASDGDMPPFQSAKQRRPQPSGALAIRGNGMAILVSCAQVLLEH